MKIAEIPVKNVMPNVYGRYIHGSSMTFGEVLVADGALIPMHHHPHEQITYILEGELEMEIGGELCLLKPGMVKVIPSNTPHGGIAHGNCRAIDVFAPVREEYR